MLIDDVLACLTHNAHHPSLVYIHIYSMQISTSVWKPIRVMKWPVVQTLRAVFSVNVYQDILEMAMNVQVREDTDILC